MFRDIQLSFHRLLLAGFIAMLSIGCGLGSSSNDVQRDSSKDGVLVINQPSVFSVLHPPQSFEVGARDLGKHMMETLVTYDTKDNQLTPLLAESWEVSDDHRTFTFSIRPEVFFHDDPCFTNGIGRELTAVDVAFCLKLMCSNVKTNENGWLLSEQVVGAKAFRENESDPLIDDLEGIQVVDDTKVQIKLKDPDVEFVHKLSHYATSIYPSEALEHYSSDLNRHPVGTGPFKMKTIRLAQVCILERHPNYWGVDEEGNRLPYLAGVKIDLTSNARSLSNAMREQIIHLVYNADELKNSELINASFEAKQANYEKSSTTKMETVYLGFLNGEGLFRDPLLRKSFACALDVEKINERVTGGSSQAAIHGIVPEGFAAYPYSETPALGFDTIQALKYLGQAGFPGGKGFPNVTLQVQNRPIDLDLAEEIQRQLLNHLGVHITISALPRDEHFERTENKNASLWIDNWVADYLAPSNFLDLMLSGNVPEVNGGYLNTYRYINPVYDNIMKEGATLSDEKTRLEKYAAADQLLIQGDAGIKPLLYTQNTCIKHKSVQGLASSELGTYNLHKVYIETPK